MKKRALISLTDKTGIVDFAQILVANGYEIISTGGTEKVLKDGGIPTINISDITGFPECLDGRVKTMHPNIHAGILAIRENNEHMVQLSALNVETIDMVIVNLYPFKETISKQPPVSLEEAIENIDIGGPTMLRAAAKNWQDVVVIVDPQDYPLITEKIKAGDDIDRELKLKLACKVFEYTAAYDTLIANYLRKATNADKFPPALSFTYEKVQEMRYGENPHQRGVFYKEVGNPDNIDGTVVAAVQLHGKELSYLNVSDTNGALELLKEFAPNTPAVVAVKHATPCGVGIGASSYEAYMNAYNADPMSIFGGIVAFNHEVDEKSAEEMSKIFLEIIIAPSFSQAAFDILTKKQNIRLLELKNITKPHTKDIYDMKKVPGGLLIQEFNADFIDESTIKVVTKKQPSEKEMRELLFAFKVVKHTKSNGIVLAKDNATIGIGPGQTNRITALELALKYAGDKAHGAVLASDAFFPLTDCVETAHKAGITAIIQPGGSIKDQDSIDLCDKYNISMVFTGMRHFKH